MITTSGISNKRTGIFPRLDAALAAKFHTYVTHDAYLPRVLSLHARTPSVTALIKPSVTNTRRHTRQTSIISSQNIGSDNSANFVNTIFIRNKRGHLHKTAPLRSMSVSRFQIGPPKDSNKQPSARYHVKQRRSIIVVQKRNENWINRWINQVGKCIEENGEATVSRLSPNSRQVKCVSVVSLITITIDSTSRFLAVPRGTSRS